MGEDMGHDARQHEALGRVAQRVDDLVVPRAAPVDVAHRVEPARCHLVLPHQQPGDGVVVVRREVRSVDRGQPDLLAEDQVDEQLGERLVHAVPQLLCPVDQVVGVVEVMTEELVDKWVHGGLPGVDPEVGGRVEVDAVGRRQPMRAVPFPTRHVVVRPRERPAEPLDRLVAGRERRVGHRGALPQLVRRALEHDPAPHRHRRLVGPFAQLTAEVEPRGVGVLRHLLE